MMAKGVEALDRLLGSLYDAVLAPAGFQPFIGQLADVFDLKGVALVVRHALGRDATGLWLHGIEPRWMESYSLTWGRQDILADHLERAPIGQFYASNLHLPEPERFGESRFYREWVQPQGVAFAAACVVMREGPWLTQAFLQRSPAQGPFTVDEVAQLDRLVPHWQRAVQMRQRLVSLRAGQDLLAASLDAISMPTLLFDEVGRIVHHNRSAAALLDAGVTLWRTEDRLMASSPAATRNLHLQISNAVRAHREGAAAATSIVVVERSGHRPLTLMTLPLRNGADQPVRSGALMFVFDPESTPVVTADLVRRLFDLSAVEAELAVALCGGQSPEEIANERGRALSTVRSQIRSLFAKTGTNRQADLIGLLLASPAYFVAREHRDALG
jgi:DNA-binding CsgD family transcriptional regulator/PAS domain-containing protein